MSFLVWRLHIPSIMTRMYQDMKMGIVVLRRKKGQDRPVPKPSLANLNLLVLFLNPLSHQGQPRPMLTLE